MMVSQKDESLLSVVRWGGIGLTISLFLTGFADLPAGETKTRQRSQPLDQGVDLGSQSAPASSEGLVTLFLGAPAAC